ncbi:MAG: acetyl-CoA carboxylase biotin carboxyl carrier protein [Planctomycetes bacterium]|nr:acetyl-CoA carboxylase biotin carboxyl carrier protein [Planctomycetota bacterium]
MDIRKLKELVRLMVTNDLTELDLRDSEEQVTLRRHRLNHVGVPDAPVVVAAPAAAPPAAGGAESSPAAVAEAQGLLTIESPMVGTYYAAANPDAAPFAAVGATITADTVVCLIEAMKIFNEIKAECAGTVVKALVENGEPVEFGQTLFLVKPD